MSGQYTDDSEMAIALAASIIAQVPMGISARAVSYQYAKFFYQPPRRGYGPAASKFGLTSKNYKTTFF
jgi:ADP-ribosylglycohydrolase